MLTQQSTSQFHGSSTQCHMVWTASNGSRQPVQPANGKREKWQATVWRHRPQSRLCRWFTVRRCTLRPPIWPIKDHGETTLPPGSSSERPVVLWKTLPAATFVSPLGLAGQTSKPPVLDCRPAAGNPDLSCATRAPIRAQPHSFDRLGAGRTDSEEEGQHGRILHTNSQHSRRMDGPCGHCE